MAPEPHISQLDNIFQLNGSDVVVIFGKTRAGKSAFINDVYGREILLSTDSMTSDTTTISYIDDELQIGDRAIRLVDTIGLGGSGHGDDTIHLARTWINVFLNEKPGAALYPTVKGFMYFIDISDAAGLNQDNQDNLQFFKSLIGTKLLDSVFFVTTKWAPAEPKGGRRKHENFFQQWKARLNKEFPGAHLVRLDDEMPRPTDEDLRDDDPDISEGEIQEAKAAYSANLKALLREVLLHSATAPTQTETEINGRDGGEKLLVDTSLGGFAKAKIDKTVKALFDAGNPNEAKRLQSAARVFGTKKVRNAGITKFTIQTVHKRGVTVSLPFGVTIHDCKNYVKNKYNLDNGDQYYSNLPGAMPEVNDSDGWLNFPLEIYPDKFQIRDGSTMLLRTDTYLGREQISKEAERLARQCGKDTLGLGLVCAGVGTAVHLLVTAGVGVAQSVNPDVKRQQLRMFKRSDKQIKADAAKGGVLLGAGSIVVNIGQNVVDGGFMRDLQDTGAERMYACIGLE